MNKILENNEKIPSIYLQALINCLIPFLMTSSLALLFVVLRKKELMNRILISFSFCVFLFQPAILKSLFEIVKCKHLYPDPGKSYIFSHMSEECYTHTYLKWIIFLVIPGFLFYTILFPFSFSFYIKTSARQSSSKSLDLLRKNHILKQGFRQDKYYW